MKTAHFFDLGSIIKSESKPWIVDKNNPNKPILKIQTYDFNLFKSGIFRSQNNRLEFNGKVFWLSNKFMDELKILTKKLKLDISNLAISMQEFLNKDIIESIDFDVSIDIFEDFINSKDDIYIFCSNNTKINFENQIKKLEEEIGKEGLKINKFYFISETFYNKDDDQLAFLKVKILLQHLIGLKISNDIFSNEEIEKYNEVKYYDDNQKAIKLSFNINSILERFVIKSDKSINETIKKRINSEDIILHVEEITHNNSNKYIIRDIPLKYSNIVKNFENFSN